MDPFLGEVRIFPWSWAPTGWALCNGASLPVQQNAALNALLGQTFGGNGSTTFNLPDLRGRTPLHLGVGQDGFAYQIGQTGGAEAVTLSVSNMPAHNHAVNALGGTKANASTPKSALPATVGLGTGMTTSINIYAPPTSGSAVALANDTFSTEGSSSPHNNVQPFLVMNFCIATLGLFPPRQ
ncbi:tail fiber protein [Azospirillum sp. TSO22-1]|uniref:phage tail protein n=1 Tax=Azospirillum sp. TSO22-1 TaxID=716789 RepID=UPI0018EEABFF|nr:tail fiber protein [Azospirillum sp. TSO22-1]